MATGAKQVNKTLSEKLDRLCGQQVAITFDDDDRQHFCTCFGIWLDRFFLTQTPMDFGTRDMLSPWKSAVVRFVEAGMLCSFKTRIVHTDPYSLIFFDHPDSITNINSRSSKRVAEFLPAFIQWHGNEYGGAIRDLSKGGCSFIMSNCQDEIFNHPGVGSTFPVKFQMHGEAAQTELNCKVVRVEEDQEELSLGISFQKSGKSILSKIGNYVSYMSEILGGEQTDSIVTV